jgi:hypothetical protein
MTRLHVGHDVAEKLDVPVETSTSTRATWTALA